MLPARRGVTDPVVGPHSRVIGHAYRRGTIASFQPSGWDYSRN
jgi:hypothetical protein